MALFSALKALPLALLLLFAEPYTFQFSSQTDGKGQAYIEINAKEPTGDVTVTIEGDDGSGTEATINLKKGQTKKIFWTQKGQAVRYDLTIESEDRRTDFNFTVTKAVAGGKAGNFQPLSNALEISEGRTMRYQTPFTLTSYTFQVFNTDGQKIVDEFVTDKVVQAGSEVKLTWDSYDEVFMLYFKGEDDLGRFSEDRRVLYNAEIPHDDVIFDSASDVVKPGESPKLDEAWASIANELDGFENAMKAVNANLGAQLYIVGYTDTVGKPGYNQKLSLKRAQSIARYLQNKGVWCEIYYAGMGEKGLKVPTPDNTDEARNRRATYILTHTQPPQGKDLPGPNAWKKLASARPRMAQKLPDPPQAYLDYKDAKRKARLERMGAPEGSGGMVGGSGGGDDGEEWGKPKGDSDGGGAAGETYMGDGDNGQGPPPVEPKGKGCHVGGESPRPALGLLVLVGLVALRRRERSAA